jgi:hypothetical protein
MEESVLAQERIAMAIKFPLLPEVHLLIRLE